MYSANVKDSENADRWLANILHYTLILDLDSVFNTFNIFQNIYFAETE